jgi:hypothetical protein
MKMLMKVGRILFSILKTTRIDKEKQKVQNLTKKSDDSDNCSLIIDN